MSQPPPCDSDILKNGNAVCMFAAPTKITEPWVVKVREESGQRVDWHYSGGRVNMLYIGDYAKVRAAIEKLLPELDEACRQHNREMYNLGDCGVGLSFFEADSRGILYRRGDPTPPGAVAASGGSFMFAEEES